MTAGGWRPGRQPRADRPPATSGRGRPPAPLASPPPLLYEDVWNDEGRSPVPTMTGLWYNPTRRAVVMLLVGRHKTRTCQGITRREVLQVGACSALGLSLAGRLKASPAAPAKQ